MVPTSIDPMPLARECEMSTTLLRAITYQSMDRVGLMLQQHLAGKDFVAAPMITVEQDGNIAGSNYFITGRSIKARIKMGQLWKNLATSEAQVLFTLDIAAFTFMSTGDTRNFSEWVTSGKLEDLTYEDEDGKQVEIDKLPDEGDFLLRYHSPILYI